VEIFHHIIEPLGFLIFIAHPFNGFTSDQVLGDLSPHLVGMWGRGCPDAETAIGHLLNIALLAVVDLDAQSAVATSMVVPVVSPVIPSVVPLGDELGTTDSAVLGPRNLSLTTAGTVHSYALSARRYVYDAPVLGNTTPGLAHFPSFVDLASDSTSLVVIVIDDGRSR